MIFNDRFTDICCAGRSIVSGEMDVEVGLEKYRVNTHDWDAYLCTLVTMKIDVNVFLNGVYTIPYTSSCDCKIQYERQLGRSFYFLFRIVV